MTSLSGVTDARDHHPDYNQSDWFCKILQTVLACSRETLANFRRNPNLSDEKLDKDRCK